jgi:hypothetical protein
MTGIARWAVRLFHQRWSSTKGNTLTAVYYGVIERIDRQQRSVGQHITSAQDHCSNSPIDLGDKVLGTCPSIVLVGSLEWPHVFCWWTPNLANHHVIDGLQRRPPALLQPIHLIQIWFGIRVIPLEYRSIPFVMS